LVKGMERESTSRGGRHEGHHHQTGYAVSVVLDRGKVNGQRRREWHSGYTSKKAAERALAALLKELDDRQHVEPDKITVGAYLEDRWLPWLKVQAKKPRTYGYHRNNVRGHLLPGIGSIRLQELDAAHLDRLYADLLDQGLAKITVFHVHQTIRKALGQARKWKLVPVNVAGDASPPQPRPWPMTIWSAPELRAFLEGVRSDRPFALWLLASSTGMRRGELLNLRWQDVDLAAGRLGVADAMTLVMTIVAPWGVWQCSDQRVAWAVPNRRTGQLDIKRVDDSSVKHIQFQCRDGTALLAYSGLAKVGTDDITDWLRRQLRGQSRTVDETLIRIREAADTNQARQASRRGRPGARLPGRRLPPRSPLGGRHRQHSRHGFAGARPLRDQRAAARADADRAGRRTGPGGHLRSGLGAAQADRAPVARQAGGLLADLGERPPSRQAVRPSGERDDQRSVHSPGPGKVRECLYRHHPHVLDSTDGKTDGQPSVR
jgi:hypothetical protein